MTDYAATNFDHAVRPEEFVSPPGRTSGLGVQFAQYPPQPFSLTVGQSFGLGTYTDASVGRVTPPKVIVDRTALQTFCTTPALDWFEKIHVLPRSKFELGNIITQQESLFEIYNSSRNTDSALISITDDVTPGISVPDISLPETIEAQSSLLDPTSTSNDTGLGLGTLVRTEFLTLTDGLPSFDGTLVFTFTLGAVTLAMSGSRIVFLPLEYEVNAGETLSFMTDIIEAIDGTEQRISVRKQPRQIFDVEYLLEGNDRQRMQAMLMDWMDNVFGFPLWHEKLELTAAVSASATQYQIEGGDQVDLRVGGLAVVYDDNATFDVIQISALTSTMITATSGSVNAYAAGTTIMPLRTARIIGAVSGKAHRVNLESFKLKLEVTDNDTGALDGDTTPGFWSIYDSRVIFDDANIMHAATMNEKFSRKVHRIDNQTGIVSATSSWDSFKRTSEKGFHARSRAEIIQLRKVLLALRGRQTAFYIPTFQDDMTAAAGFSIGAYTLDIELIDYVRFVKNRRQKKLFRITFTDETSLDRTISSSAGIDSTTERLTLVEAWPATRTLAEISRIEFYELVRFDSDNLKITHQTSGKAVLRAPVKVVFDDNV